MNTSQQTTNHVQTSLSVQKVSRRSTRSGRLSPTHQDHWRTRVFLPKYRRKDGVCEAQCYSTKIQYAGRRETLALHTSNLEDAARKARDIYLLILRDGWDAALAKHKPKPMQVAPEMTVGEFIRLLRLTGILSATTFNAYTSKLRTIVAWISGIGSGRARGVRFREWRAKIDAKLLTIVTEESCKRFKREYLARATATPVSLRHAQVTIDAYVRNMRSLFREEIVKEIAGLGATVPKMPFNEISYVVKGASGYAYVSTIEAEALTQKAAVELAPTRPEEFKIFVLALLLGLRRGEIDQLRWSMINWERGHIALTPHEFLHLKTASSQGEVLVDPALLEILRQYHEVAKGDYVVESPNAPRLPSHYRHYRCAQHFKQLCGWLFSQGVKARSPIHTLRKECGSLVNEKWGLVAAKNTLRHATIDITVTYYVRDRRRTSTGLESLLPVVAPKSVA